MNSCPKSIHIFIYHQAPESTFSVLLGMLKDHIIQGCSYFWIFQAMRPPEQQLPTSESSKRRGQFDHSSSTMLCYHDDLAPPMCSRYHRPSYKYIDLSLHLWRPDVGRDNPVPSS